MKVSQDPEKPVEPEILAEAIVRVSDAMKQLTASGLNRRAVVILLRYYTGISMKEIDQVLDGLEKLKKEYCR